MSRSRESLKIMEERVKRDAEQSEVLADVPHPGRAEAQMMAEVFDPGPPVPGQQGRLMVDPSKVQVMANIQRWLRAIQS